MPRPLLAEPSLAARDAPLIRVASDESSKTYSNLHLLHGCRVATPATPNSLSHHFAIHIRSDRQPLSGARLQGSNIITPAHIFDSRFATQSFVRYLSPFSHSIVWMYSHSWAVLWPRPTANCAWHTAAVATLVPLLRRWCGRCSASLSRGPASRCC